ncbi:hypothetical protein MRX96_016006 [Rhipicephalus microplus]
MLRSGRASKRFLRSMVIQSKSKCAASDAVMTTYTIRTTLSCFSCHVDGHLSYERGRHAFLFALDSDLLPRISPLNLHYALHTTQYAPCFPDLLHDDIVHFARAGLGRRIRRSCHGTRTFM